MVLSFAVFVVLDLDGLVGLLFVVEDVGFVVEDEDGCFKEEVEGFDDEDVVAFVAEERGVDECVFPVLSLIFLAGVEFIACGCFGAEVDAVLGLRDPAAEDEEEEAPAREGGLEGGFPPLVC